MTGSVGIDIVDGMTKRCGARAPDSLAGERNLRCLREVSKHGWHQGQHKTHMTTNVGKLTITWPQGEEYQPKRTTQPPEVRLPVHEAIKLSRLRCTCVGAGWRTAHDPGCAVAGRI